jgi:hypothetical protein
MSHGSDKIPNYCLKAFHSTHSYIMKIFHTVIEKPKQMPDWLTYRNEVYTSYIRRYSGTTKITDRSPVY